MRATKGYQFHIKLYMKGDDYKELIKRVSNILNNSAIDGWSWNNNMGFRECFIPDDPKEDIRLT